MSRPRVYMGATSTTAVLLAYALASAAGVAPTARARPTGGRDEDDNYDHSRHTGGRRDYSDIAEAAQCESPRDDRPEWQKIGDRKGRSRPNKGRR